MARTSGIRRTAERLHSSRDCVGLSLQSAAGGHLSAAFHEDLQRQAGRDHARVVSRRRRGQDARPARAPDRRHPPPRTQRRPPPRGTQKPQYTPHVDTGDFVIVVNAEKIQVTGNKLDQKRYYRHSGYPGALRSRTLREQLDRRPTEVIRVAVKGMLPKNRLARQQITKLKIYAGPEHPHEGQNPKPLEAGAVATSR